MRKYIVQSFTGSALPELNWRALLVEGGILLGFFATGSWLAR